MLYIQGVAPSPRNLQHKENAIAADTKQHAHELLDQLAPGQLAAVAHLLEVMIEDEGDELTEDDRQAIRSSREYFQQNPEGGLPFEDIVAGCGFTVDEVRKTE